MKKICSLLLAMAIMLSLFPAITSFAAVGDIIGYAKYTDIAAYINNYPINSYNINGYTAIVAEDLRNYGFSVEWNSYARTLSITRNYNSKTISPKEKVYAYASKAGQNSFAYLKTDIVTYVNGSRVDSFNIDGKTCIYINSLSPYGTIEWLSNIRVIKLWVEGLPKTEFKPVIVDPITMYSAETLSSITVSASEKAEYERKGWFNSYEAAKARRDYLISLSSPGRLTQSQKNSMSNKCLAEIKKKVYNDESINIKDTKLWGAKANKGPGFQMVIDFSATTRSGKYQTGLGTFDFDANLNLIGSTVIWTEM